MTQEPLLIYSRWAVCNYFPIMLLAQLHGVLSPLRFSLGYGIWLVTMTLKFVYVVASWMNACLPVQKAAPKTAECAASPLRIISSTACQRYGVLAFSGLAASERLTNYTCPWLQFPLRPRWCQEVHAANTAPPSYLIIEPQDRRVHGIKKSLTAYSIHSYIGGLA